MPSRWRFQPIRSALGVNQPRISWQKFENYPVNHIDSTRDTHLSSISSHDFGSICHYFLNHGCLGQLSMDFSITDGWKNNPVRQIRRSSLAWIIRQGIISLINSRNWTVRIVIFFIQGNTKDLYSQSSLKSSQMVYLSQASWSDEMVFPIWPGNDISSPFHFFFTLKRFNSQYI